MRYYYFAAAFFSLFFLLILYLRMRHLRVLHKGTQQFQKFVKASIGMTAIDCLWGILYAEGHGANELAFTVTAYLYVICTTYVSYRWTWYISTYLESPLEKLYLNRVCLVLSWAQLFILALNPFTGEVFRISAGTKYDVGFMRSVIFGMQGILYTIVCALLITEKRNDAEKSLYRYARWISILPLAACFLAWHQSDSPFYSIGCMTVVLNVFILNVTQVLITDNRVMKQQRDELDREYNAMRDAYYTAGQAGKVKRKFLTRFSRDMRAPVSSIMGLSSVAAAHINDRERVADCLTKIKESAQSVLKLFADTLDMEKNDGSVTEKGSVRIVIRQFIEEMFDEARAMAREKGQRVNITVRDISHNVVLGDAERIKQCFNIIVENAVMYSPVGSTIDITMGETSSAYEGLACYEFTVEDKGIGMDRKQLSKIFDPFDREDRVKDGRTGLGFGLVIAQNIVTMMNGEIKIESAPQVGTKVYFNIFLDLAEKLTENAVDLTGACVLADFSSVRALLAGGDEDSRDIAFELLSATGMQIDIAESGRACVEKFISSQPGWYDVIFMDAVMPCTEGQEAVREIRALNTDYAARIPIFVMTADMTPIDVIEAKNDGIIEYLPKPVDMQKLVTVMRNYFR